MVLIQFDIPKKVHKVLKNKSNNKGVSLRAYVLEILKKDVNRGGRR